MLWFVLYHGVLTYGEEGMKKGIKVCVSSWRRLAPDTIPTEAKASGNCLSYQF